MDGADNRYKYYFTIKNNQPCILQTFENEDITWETIKELTNDSRDYFNHHSRNMLLSLSIALNNDKIKTYLIFK